MPFLIPIFVGVSAAASTTGVATAGLIGAGGAVTAGGVIGATAVGASIAGGVMSAQAANQQGKDQQAMMRYNARVKEQEAKAIEEKGIFDSRRQAEAGSRDMASLEAGLGGSGAIPTAGSPLLIQAKQASEIELENLTIGQNTITDATNLRNQSQLDIAQGKLYRRAGKNAAMSSYMNTGTTVLSGLYKMKTGNSLN